MGACLAPRKLLIANPTGGAGERLRKETMNEVFSVINAAYKFRGAESRLNVIEGIEEDALSDLYSEWIID